MYVKLTAKALLLIAIISACVQVASTFSCGFYTKSRRCTQSLFAKSKKKKKPNDGNISINRLAYRNYELLETIEAGVSLLGTEIKSIRMKGSMNLRDGYIKCNKFGQSTLHNVHIAKFKNAGAYFQHEEKRVRNLLLHKQEARKLAQRTETMPGMTIVPIKAYFRENKLKVQIALCRGKNTRDKRASIQARDAKREENRIIKNFKA